MLTAVLGILVGFFVVLAITALTGYFVAQEFAYMAVDRSRLKARAEAGDNASARALAVTRRTSFMLSGAQLGITVTGLLVGYVAEPLIGQGLEVVLGGAGLPTVVAVGIGGVAAIAVSTVVQMVFGELFPKNLAIARPEPLARWLALSTTLYLKLFGWLIWLFDQSSNMLLRLLRIEPVHDVEHSATPRDLEHIVAASREAGEIPKDLSALLDRILDFPTSNAEHAMIPRSRVDVVAADEAVSEVLERMAHGHTRYPVTGSGPDDVVGVIDLHDLLGPDLGSTGTAGNRCRPAVVVPETLPLPDVVRELAQAGDEMAIVIDEYGGFAGIVTVEDLAEELVGEIDDEHDTESTADVIARDGGWLLAGDLPLDEAERTLELTLPAGDYETVAGMVIAQAGGLPAPGDTVEIELPTDTADLVHDGPPPMRRIVAEVRAVERRVPSSVFVTVDTASEESDDE
ncbi:hemolysin family protein [Mycolicibacterium litorale]|uniref:Membrane protein n=1 Tax=Mycolicibacterium litorale TaxID=758802 RepID=A0AAD1IGS5_9MYCO|nr:hemolysin family protein [Mycolicibacterium litorale]MCV7413711.1 HlyC/CorC family transporter [Mycolicibacterium litorale]TDY03407.1 CBS domain containing-hemolysin-like protein [Mycolicibacterium litorale]BBY15204.1 membrane protein [Mycolicibacterium litorale]